MPKVILDDHEAASFKRDGRTLLITGSQIRQRARKHRDPVALSTTTTIGITEDDQPYLEWDES